MKQGVIIAACVIALSMCPLKAVAMEPQHTMTLNNCRDDILKVEFLCDPEWNIKSDKGVLLVIIAQRPYVTFSISRSDEPVMFLDELTSPMLQALGGYDNDFMVNELEFAGKDGLEVFGHAMDDPQTKMLDYYALHNTRLYRFQFTVKPQSAWEKVQNVIMAIRNSTTFIK